MSGYDPFTGNQIWGNTSPTLNGASVSFDHTSSHPQQSQGFQELGASVAATSYPYSKLNQIPGASETSQHQHTPYGAQISPTTQVSRSTSRSRYPPAAQPAVVPQLDISSQDYHPAAPAAWAAPSDPPVHAGRHRLSHSGGRVDYSNNQSSSTQQPSLGQQRRPSYDPLSPPTPTREDTRMSVDPSPGQPRCIIPGCRYPAYFNVAEQEQKEYCGHGHEIEAIETGIAKPCAMCKGRPRRIGERVCGPVCRDRERQALQVQGSYYGVQVTRREPQTRPR